MNGNGAIFETHSAKAREIGIMKIWLIIPALIAEIFWIHTNDCFAQNKAKLDTSFHASPKTFAQALAPRAWQFPRDHGQHPEFRTEWWYFTGNLKNQEGRRFGYQLTFFRTALLLNPVARTSQWAFRDAYIGHFTITDIKTKKFYYDQRVARGALQLANSASDSLAVYVGDWSAKGGNDSIRLNAEAAFGGLAFLLESQRSPVLHGQNGLARKGRQLEEASYYYSRPQLKTGGALRMGEDTFAVEGVSWMDHEFFTGPEKSEVEGWDWMSLHLSDSTAIMLYLLRAHDGNILPFSGGTLIFPNGTSRGLRMNDFAAEPFSWWTSSSTGGKYPVGWRLKIGNYWLELTTPVPSQELDTRATTGLIYWEGYVEVAGKNGDRSIDGVGYLEMTGYVKAARHNL